MAVYSPHKIAIPSRNMGPAPAKLRGQVPGHETPVFALIESIGWKSFLPLRAESKGITSRLAGRWPFLPLSWECRSKSFATLNLLCRPTYFKALRVQRWWSLVYDTRSENRLFVWILQVTGNTKA